MAKSLIGVPSNTLNYSPSDLYYSPYTNSGNPNVSYMGFACGENATASNLYANISTNASSSAVVIVLNVNGVDSSLSISIPASTTGVFSDLSNSAALNAGDLICFKVSGPASGFINGSISMSLDI